MDLWISAVRRDVYTPHITTSVPIHRTDTDTDILAVDTLFYHHYSSGGSGADLDEVGTADRNVEDDGLIA